MKFSLHTNFPRISALFWLTLQHKLTVLNVALNVVNPSKGTTVQSRVKRYSQGFSLAECLVVLVLTVSLLSFSYSYLQGFLMRQERARYLSSLQAAVVFARSQAFLQNTTLTLCGSHSLQKCHMQKDWSTGFIVFVNSLQDIEPKEGQILRKVPGIRYGKLQFTGISPLLHISSQGLTMNIGTFLYCPNAPNNNKAEWDGLVINRAFRAYRVKDHPNKVEALECRYTS